MLSSWSFVFGHRDLLFITPVIVTIHQHCNFQLRVNPTHGYWRSHLLWSLATLLAGLTLTDAIYCTGIFTSFCWNRAMKHVFNHTEFLGMHGVSCDKNFHTMLNEFDVNLPNNYERYFDIFCGNVYLNFRFVNRLMFFRYIYCDRIRKLYFMASAIKATGR